MDIAALLTSAGINVALCAVLFSLYSVLRKQPGNRIVYFGRRLASVHLKCDRDFTFERFVPSPSWIVKAWGATEEEILAIGGMDALILQRILIFSMRVFSIAAIICMFLVLPVNYHGKQMQHKQIPAESLDVFTIGNVKEGSSWLWTHCLALYIISCSATTLLYFEYKSIAKLRLEYITRSAPSVNQFTILVRSIPWSPGQSYSETVKKFFSHYYASSYMSHQMVYHRSLIRKLMVDAGKVCQMIKAVPVDQPSLRPCCLCAKSVNSFKILSSEPEGVKDGVSVTDLNVKDGVSVTDLNVEDGVSVADLNVEDGVSVADLNTIENERPAAFVFFKTRFAAVVSAQMCQSSNPMLWVTELAPEPHDVLWSNLSIPYRQLWLRKIATLLAAIVFMFLFLVPVTFVQGLTQLDTLSRTFPFLRGLLKKDFMNHVITGYLPSVILMLFLYTVPPTMMLFSSVEGLVSRSGRKKSACLKILYFTVWNVFFVNVLSGSIISQLNVFSSVRDIPTQLAKAIPTQATFFMTYVLTSGWASLACELMQLFPFLCNLFRRFILRNKEDSSEYLMSFPYHTEIPRVLLFGLIGFTCSIMAPLILPLLLVYFILAYLVYRNQILNVYIPKYETGGKFWPVVHNATIFSLVLTQIIALGVFGIKESPVASGFTFPLIICTLLFNEYCRQRFSPIFKKDPAEVLIDLDIRDEQSGRMKEIYEQFHSAYCQLPLTSHEFCENSHPHHHVDELSIQDPETIKPEKELSEVSESRAVVNFGKEESIE